MIDVKCLFLASIFLRYLEIVKVSSRRLDIERIFLSKVAFMYNAYEATNRQKALLSGEVHQN